ncbi:hypothetical protein Efla_006321 [Eimeria flavescens]
MVHAHDITRLRRETRSQTGWQSKPLDIRTTHDDRVTCFGAAEYSQPIRVSYKAKTHDYCTSLPLHAKYSIVRPAPRAGAAAATLDAPM